MKKEFIKYLFLLVSQLVSQFGTAMTSFALILWIYEQEGTALSVSIMSICAALPYVLGSGFAGVIVDKYKKKHVMLISDLIAAFCSLIIVLLVYSNLFEPIYLYIINIILGFTNAIQSPASKVLLGKMVPSEQLERTSGIRSLGQSIVTVFAPVLGTTCLAFGGIRVVLFIDLITFAVAFVVLGVMKINDVSSLSKKVTIKDGLNYLKKEKGLLKLMVYLSCINVLAALTVMNLLSPMLLKLTSNNLMLVGRVNGSIGLGGIIGAVLVTVYQPKIKKHQVIFLAAMVSYIFGDIIFVLVRNEALWLVCGIFSTLLIPYLNAAEMTLVYMNVPSDMQGRVFAIRGSVQFIGMPIGYLLGGLLADYVFEPYFQHKPFLFGLQPSSPGNGIAWLFLLTGIIGIIVSIKGLKDESIIKLSESTLISEKSIV